MTVIAGSVFTLKFVIMNLQRKVDTGVVLVFLALNNMTFVLFSFKIRKFSGLHALMSIRQSRRG